MRVDLNAGPSIVRTFVRLEALFTNPQPYTRRCGRVGRNADNKKEKNRRLTNRYHCREKKT